MPRRRLDRLPIYEQTRAATLIDPDEEVRLVGRHHDNDHDGIADQIGRRSFTHDDGSVYERIPSDEIDDDGDLIDSTTVEDPGAPD